MVVHARRCVEKGVPVPDWVFPSLEGTPLEERNVRHVFKRLLEKASAEGAPVTAVTSAAPARL